MKAEAWPRKPTLLWRPDDALDTTDVSAWADERLVLYIRQYYRNHVC